MNNKKRTVRRNGKKVTVEKGMWQGSPYIRKEYKDGSSETSFGGPCGPIYTDRDGNA